MKIAIEGCAHGELDKIYEVLTNLEEENKIKVDLLLICGDFQSVRNLSDLQCMAVPQRYRKLNTFYKYYSGEKVAPVLTIFVGGNHEASNYLTELHYGGWVCPNIYYLGRAGVLQFGGIRIAGLSGIYKGNDYLKGHFEIPPFNQGTIRSVYHVRKLEVFKLSQISEPLDVVLSHDWPRGIYHFGNTGDLIKRKPFFKKEIDEGTLGSPPAEELLSRLQPKYWFSAHLHCKFAALVPHQDGQTTKFLALDKCLPRRKFLQVIDIEAKEGYPLKLSYDLEWLAILKKTDDLLNTTFQITHIPWESKDNSLTEQENREKSKYFITEENKAEIAQLLTDNKIETSSANGEPSCYLIPTDFEGGPPAAGAANSRDVPLVPRTNDQTTKLCKILGITDPTAKLIVEIKPKSLSLADFSGSSWSDNPIEASGNPDEIDLGQDDEPEEELEASIAPSKSSTKEPNPDTTGDNGLPLFIIDTKPKAASTPFKRLAMILPPPISTTKQPEEKELSGVLKTVAPENSVSDDQGLTPDKSTSGPRTLKRRNIAMYSNNDDDDDDDDLISLN